MRGCGAMSICARGEGEEEWVQSAQNQSVKSTQHLFTCTYIHTYIHTSHTYIIVHIPAFIQTYIHTYIHELVAQL
jgi:hypothetical protein